MILKILAAASVIMGGGYIGIIFSSKLDNRAKQIEQFRLAIAQIGFNIKFLKMPVGMALSNAAKIRHGVVEGIFSSAAEDISKKSIATATAFERAVLKSRDKLCISKEELEIISDFAENLGKGDVESEINNINASCAKLELARENAENLYAQKGKLYRGLGLLGGILLVIVLF